MSNEKRTSKVQVLCRKCNNVESVYLEPQDAKNFIKGSVKVSQISYLSPEEKEVLRGRICLGCIKKLKIDFTKR